MGEIHTLFITVILPILLCFYLATTFQYKFITLFTSQHFLQLKYRLRGNVTFCQMSKLLYCQSVCEELVLCLTCAKIKYERELEKIITSI